jgi:two-component system sensor histidine kinase RegB
MKLLPLADSPETRTFATSIGLAFYVRMRWLFAGLAVLAILLARLAFGVSLPLPGLLSCVLVGLATNLYLALAGRRREASPAFLGAVLTFDTVLVTVGLALSGGAHNPFTAILLVYVVLAAVVLGSRWAFALAAIAIACFGALFLVRADADGHAHHAHMMGDAMDMHLYGMLVAFAATAALSSYLVTRVTRALALYERELEVARAHAERTERLAALTTLAAGAAHELGTPLGTIAVVAGELEHRAASSPGSEALIDDARLIRAEIDRCRSILDQLSGAAGEGRGEVPLRVPIAEIVADVTSRLAESRARRLHVRVNEGVDSIRVPKNAFVQVVLNLVTNAFDASNDESAVDLVVDRREGLVSIEVVDRGSGMTEAELARAVEPFYTTKPEGRGMGLGLYLSRAVAEQLGGSLTVDSTKGSGTTARVEVPS